MGFVEPSRSTHGFTVSGSDPVYINQYSINGPNPRISSNYRARRDTVVNLAEGQNIARRSVVAETVSKRLGSW
jgi:hypothetical protein